jgi:AAA domain/PD-(D/E)XK nuclease superfamily
MVSQFVRLDQCRRYLRLALHERAAGSGFMERYDVAPQAITPLLTRAGQEFEEDVEAAAAARFPTRNFGREPLDRERAPDIDEVITAAGSLQPGQVMVLFQARLRASLHCWDLTGDADILRLERNQRGELSVLIADMKASRTAKVEHRLQVALYRAMLEQVFADAALPCAEIATAILYRGMPEPADPNDADEVLRIAAERDLASRLFGIDDAQLELTPDPAAYRDAVRDLVTGTRSVASDVCEAEFAALPWHLTAKCDGCLYNEFCMKWAAEHDDLSLLPHLTAQDKAGLQRGGITTTRELANLFAPDIDRQTGKPDLAQLQPAPHKAAVVRSLRGMWPVGPRLEELVHRARRYRHWQGDQIGYLPYIPSKGYGSLPYSDPEHNPNLVRVYIDAQHDYLTDRLYLLGALAVGNEDGQAAPARRRIVVEMTEGPPDSDAERAMLLRWTDATIRAIAEVAAPDAGGEPRAPIHLIFFNSSEQRLLLEALNRHAREVLSATPLYDFLTQLAAFDSPVVTFLDQEIRELKNYPMVCQSLQAVATTARPHGQWFEWNVPEPYREIFRERVFDALGRFGGSDDVPARPPPWSTRRARFSSAIPLEYAYAAWGELAPPASGERDPYQAYRGTTAEILRRFQQRRLEALEHVSSDFAGNRDTTKTSFLIPQLDEFSGKANGLAEALQEFVTIERHVALAAWKAARLAPPERRVLAGDTLLVSYHEEDQLPGVADINAENRRRAALREEQLANYRAANPEAEKIQLSKEEKALSAACPIEDPIRLRIDVDGSGLTLEETLSLSSLASDDWVVVAPRWTVDSRLPPEEQRPLTPTPKQLLYAMRRRLIEVETEQDAAGRIERAWATIGPAQTGQSSDPPGFLFWSHDLSFVPGETYTLDADPNDIFGFWGAKVVRGLVEGRRNALFARLRQCGEGTVIWPAAAAEGQARFMDGLEAMHAAGDGKHFEPSKIAFVGSHGDEPLLLVQGPPGTGKSFTTAFAILARVQGALAAGMPFRVLVGAKTHAATDVLLHNIVAAQEVLCRLEQMNPALFAAHFDERLLDVPLYRLQPREGVPDGVTPVYAGHLRDKSQPRPFQLFMSTNLAIVGSTPGGVYRAASELGKAMFDQEVFDLLVLDEASQLSLPEAIMAALALKPDRQVVVVGDHRQMAPIVKHDWDNEARRTFKDYAVYRSLFDTVRQCRPAVIQFERSFRLDQDMAEFLRRHIYVRDNLHFHSTRSGRIRQCSHDEGFVCAALDPAHPLVVIVHDEAGSQLRNDFERDLTTPIVTTLHDAGYRVEDGMGLVVLHRAQRASLQAALRRTLPAGDETGDVALAVDTVERFQGGERTAIIVSATESDPEYLLAAGKFLYDPRRFTVAISRAKDKLIVVASRSVFDLFSPDEETFANAQLWKDLLHRTCTISLWSGEFHGQRVDVWGNPPLTDSEGSGQR